MIKICSPQGGPVCRVDLYKIDTPEHLKEQPLAKAIKQAARFLEKQGLTIA